MQEVTQLHHDAMELADAADAAQRQGYPERAADLNRQAFEKEREVADTIADRDDLEPTRSILHRSAASLALICNEISEAERLITYALSTSPPVEIADELRDLLKPEVLIADVPDSQAKLRTRLIKEIGDRARIAAPIPPP